MTQKPLLQSQQDQPKQKQQKNNKKKSLEFSKKLTIVDIVVWAVTAIALLVVMLVRPEIAEYCVSIFTTSTAAYVSLRLGYTAKAGVENYKKIAKTYNQVATAKPDDYYDEDEILG